VQHIDYNLLYRWFVGMNLDEAAWNHSTFSANRERLFSEAMTQRFFAPVAHRRMAKPRFGRTFHR